ncbi:MAG: hypothetical protein P5702_19615 [Limnospira sp. PMC 1291.21]|uniref:Uncharacterized protein n=1 Tax=Limnospira indica PCC 8005 TaxID=376219 RepID=A0A9P1P198_9CYAN|nr:MULTISPECIES: hypothetical protein [Limnospira]QJB24980.1 hypothetical protein HFV01_03100 [Limnospira fusiformis SAG 85.79]MDT9179840.1 hypothetical protein [Limnospira sp. PMC 1238.20]MDT9195096.1 hypothetical protein [Limnospira sp. PMC 1245.20]MDT9205335.1 hypothetical protein [Limnospira sp. PMC 1243.20]MDT9210503.1 hypothetical protein [Limnospira sp. PMC 1252.20]
MKVFVHTRTIFKAEPLPANQLPTHKKIEVPAGASFIGRFEIHRLPWHEDHHHVILASNLGSGEQNRSCSWYVPKVHVDIFECLARVKTEGLNLRRSPNPNDSNNIIEKLPLGAFVEIFDATYVNQNLGIWWSGRPLCTADQQHWFSNAYSDPKVGWMSSKHLDMTELKYDYDNRDQRIVPR